MSMGSRIGGRAWSLQARLALAVGLAVTVLWLAAAAVTAHRLSSRLDVVFDDDLKATAERILPIALHDLGKRGEGEAGDDDHEGERGDDDREVERLPDEMRDVAWVVRGADGRVLLQSPHPGLAALPDFAAPGFQDVDGWRIYSMAAADGRATITLAEPLTDRDRLARSMLIDLSLPLLVVIPLSLLGIALAIRRGLVPLGRLERALAARGARDLSPLAETGLPRELRPFTAEVNGLMARLAEAFEAERSFAAHAAHELRTPVAGAIAQAQRLRAESADPAAVKRAGEIEAVLKRLMRTSEKLMQLARAEGAQMRLTSAADVRPVLRIVAGDFERQPGGARLQIDLPGDPVLSVIEPDALGILCRNLIENALRHGAADQPVILRLRPEAVMQVENGGPALPAGANLTDRFQKGRADGEGAGLGLAIVTAITERAGAAFRLISPIPGRQDGVLAEVALPRG